MVDQVGEPKQMIQFIRKSQLRPPTNFVTPAQAGMTKRERKSAYPAPLVVSLSKPSYEHRQNFIFTRAMTRLLTTPLAIAAPSASTPRETPLAISPSARGRPSVTL